MVDISPEDRRAGHDFQEVIFEKPAKKTNSTSLNMAKVYGYMFMLLAITAVVSIGLGIIFTSFINNDPVIAATVLFYLVIGSSCALFILNIIMSFCLNKSKGSTLALSIIYSIVMGVTLSSFTTFLPWEVLGVTFLITSAIFGLLALIGTLSKGNMHPVGLAALGLLFGSFLVLGFNFLFAFLLPELWNALCWIVSFVVFAAIMLSTIYDVWSIRKMIDQIDIKGSIAVWCAFRLYVDFINIFIRVLYYVVIIFAKKK